MKRMSNSNLTAGSLRNGLRGIESQKQSILIFIVLRCHPIAIVGFLRHIFQSAPDRFLLPVPLDPFNPVGPPLDWRARVPPPPPRPGASTLSAQALVLESTPLKASTNFPGAQASCRDLQ